MSTQEDFVGTVHKRRALEALRGRLAEYKRAALNKAQAEGYRAELAQRTLEEMAAVDGYNGNGVRFQYEGQELAAFACQPEPEKYWDPAKLVEHLKKTGVWDRVSTTVLDPQKLEAEIASGNIRRSSLDKFIVQKPKSPYVKFINPKPDSK
jgi:hypothetical protein